MVTVKISTRAEAHARASARNHKRPTREGMTSVKLFILRSAMVVGIMLALGISASAASSAAPALFDGAGEASVVNAEATSNVPDECTLRKIDGNRTSEANCDTGNWFHVTSCTDADTGHLVRSYGDPFTSYHTRHCPSGTRVGNHSIQDKNLLTDDELAALSEPNRIAADEDCSLRIIDAGRTSEAACGDFDEHTHYTRCEDGEAYISYFDDFTVSHTRSCPTPYRVGYHSIII